VDAKVEAAMAAMPPDMLPGASLYDDDDEAGDGGEGAGAPPMGMDQNHPLWVDDEDAAACADCGALW